MAEVAVGKLSEILDLRTAESLRAFFDRKYPLKNLAAECRAGNERRVSEIAYSRCVVEDLDDAISEIKRKDKNRVLPTA